MYNDQRKRLERKAVCGLITLFANFPASVLTVLQNGRNDGCMRRFFKRDADLS